MRTFFLDLASHASRMACVEDAVVQSMKEEDRRLSDADLVPLFDAALKEAGWHAVDGNRIACVTGPGGFTGLRIAVTFANVLADQLRIPLAGIHVSDVYAARASVEKRAAHSSQLTAHSCVWLHATKRESLFIRGFGALADRWPDPRLITLDELTAALPPHASVMGELLPAHRDALRKNDIVDMPLRPLEDVLPSFLQTCTYEKRPVEPWYGRGW